MKTVLRLAVVLMLAAATCRATTVIPMSVEQLTRAASDVVEGSALRSWTAWNPQHTILYTFTEFAVAQRLKGNAPQTVVVKQMGGHADGVIQRVAGLRYFQDGESALLFLRPSAARDGSHVIVGMMQGNFRVWTAASGRRMASNGIAGVQSLEGGEVRTFGGAAMELSSLETRVRQAVRP